MAKTQTTIGGPFAPLNFYQKLLYADEVCDRNWANVQYDLSWEHDRAA